MKRNVTLTNALWLIFGKTVRMGLQLILGVLIARYLGPSDYGLLQYAAAYTGFFASLCTLGLENVMVKALADGQGKEGELLGTALVLQLISGTVSSLAILTIVGWADRGDAKVLAVVCLSAIGMVLRAFDILHCWFQFRQQSRVTALVSLAAYLLAAGGKVLLLLGNASVVWFGAAAALEQLCSGGMLLAAYGTNRGGKLRFSRKTARNLLRKSIHFILPGLMVAVFAQTDRIMLKQLISPGELACYSVAATLCNAWCFVLMAIIDAMYPVIARAEQLGEAAFRRRNRQLYAIVFYLSMGVSTLIWLLAEPVVGLLYGEAYQGAAQVLRVLTWYTAFSYLGVARNAWMVCKNRQHLLIWVYAAAAASNVGLNLLLIPQWGAVGAAAASLAAQILTTLVAPFCLKGLRENGKLMVEAICLKNVMETGRRKP